MVDDQPTPAEDGGPVVAALVEKLTEGTRKIGLYVESAGLGATDGIGPTVVSDLAAMKKVVAGDDGDLLLMVGFAIGDVAFSKRVQNPEQDEVDDQVRAMLPDPVAEIKERLRKAKEEGKDIFDVDPFGE